MSYERAGTSSEVTAQESDEESKKSCQGTKNTKEGKLNGMSRDVTVVK